MFKRKKIIGGKERWYLVQSYRDKDSGKVRQRTMAYLGAFNSIYKRRLSLKSRLRLLSVELEYTKLLARECEYAAASKKITLRPPGRGESRGLHPKWWRSQQRATKIQNQIARIKKQLAALYRPSTCSA